MRVVIEEIGEDGEEEIIVRCRRANEELLGLVNRIRSASGGVSAVKDGEIYKLALGDIFYFEVVENKSFLYCEREVYESKLKLYEFEELSRGTGFFRATKSTVLNADKIESIAPSISGRFFATLSNGERVIVSRQYVSSLKKIMGV